MRIAPAILLTICYCVSGLFAGTEAEQSDELVGRWEELPLFPSRRAIRPCIGIEPSGALWVPSKNIARYWDGEKLVELDNLNLPSGNYVYGLHGGMNRKLYASRSNKQNNNNQLYELVDGQAIYITDFHHDKSYNHPALYVSKSGLLCNWGTRFLAVYIQNQWKQIEAYLHPRYALTFDSGEKVHFYYNRNLYSVDRHGNFDKRQISAPIESIPGRKRIHGAVWGQDKMLIFDCGSKQVYAYYLDSGEPVDTEPIHSYLDNRPVYDLFSTNNGDVWLLIRDPELRTYVFLRITPEGDITTVNETARLGWDNTQFWQYPHSVLSASDGSIWLSSRRDGIVRYKNGRMQIFGWRQGVNFGRCRYILEGSQGQIYVSSDNGVHVFLPGQPAKPPAWVHEWQDYRINSLCPVRDSEGYIWMLLEDHPGWISRWDGYRWNHIKVPFDTSKYHWPITDDKGHILLLQQGSVRWYDISQNEVNQYKNFKDMLVAAVARGAKRFNTDDLGIVVKNSKIWVGHHSSCIVSYFDGDRWDDFLVSRIDIDYLYESPKYGIMIRSEAGKYYALDRGHITPIEIPKQTPSRWLMGSKSLQPFEQEILDAHTDEYIPVERAEDGKLYMLVRRESNDTSTSLDNGYRRADLIDRDITRVKPGLWGGHWSDHLGGGICRFFGGRALGCDFHKTPVSHIDKSEILEDRAHNLWVVGGHVFMKRLSDFKLTTEKVPTETKRSVTIKTKALLASQPQSNTRLFWRFKEGPWHGGERTNSATIYFPTDGIYQIDMVAMEPIGGITPEINFTINATVSLPDTILTETAPYISKDIIWQIPASAVPSEPGQIPHFAYRIDEKEWQQAYKDKMISFQGLEPCEYNIQVAAVEEERYYDVTPLSFNVTFAPDYNLIVKKRLDLIISNDPNESQTALTEIKMAGPDVLGVLQQRLAEARKAEQTISFLERLIREIQRGLPQVKYPHIFDPIPPPPQRLAKARKIIKLIGALERLIREIQQGPQNVEHPRRFDRIPPPPPPPRQPIR
jgi:hypothetical protein